MIDEFLINDQIDIKTKINVLYKLMKIDMVIILDMRS